MLMEGSKSAVGYMIATVNSKSYVGETFYSFCGFSTNRKGFPQ